MGMILNPFRYASSGANGEVYDAIQALSPLSHFPMRETSGSTIEDVGSLGNDGTYGTMTLAAITGADGFDYPQVSTATSGSGASAPDVDGYSPGTASGVTAVLLVRPTALATNVCLAKWGDGTSTDDEWIVRLESDGDIWAYRSRGDSLQARGFFTTAGGVVTTNVWNLIIVRFPSSTSGYPTLRVNGSAPTGSNSGSGTSVGNEAGPLQIMRNHTNAAFQQGYVAHVAVFAGEISDTDAGTIESAASSEGWY